MPSPTRILLSLALFWSIARPAFAVPQPGDIDYINITPNNPDIVVGEEYSDWAYSAEFAKRFKLDKSKVEQMSPGLMAVEFRAEATTNKGFSHVCYFNIYIDDSLPIQYPENRSAGYLKDVQHINRSIPYENRQEKDKAGQPIEWMYHAALSPIKIKKPFVSEITSRLKLDINSYRKHIFPGVSYLSLMTINCSEILPAKFPSQLLLRKKGAFDSIVMVDFSDLLKLKIPINFHSRICPYIEKIAYLSLNELITNVPNLKHLYKVTQEKFNNYPIGCK